MALKRSSSTIVIGASVLESAANTYTQERVDLQLNPLDNEVFVVEAINMDTSFPDGIAGTDTQVTMAVTTTDQSTIGLLANSSTMARKASGIRAAGFADAAAAFSESAGETPPSQLDYVAIISTNDFFLGIVGSGNVVAKSGAIKMYGYRAKADSATYAALVQSEVLSA